MNLITISNVNLLLAMRYFTLLHSPYRKRHIPDFEYVLIEIINKDTVRAVATDGHILGAMKIPCEVEQKMEPGRIQIPAQHLEPKLWKNAPYLKIQWDSSSCFIISYDTKYTFNTVSNFIQYEQIIPLTVTNQLAQFDFRYFKLILKIQRELKKAKALDASLGEVYIHYNGNKPSIIDIGAGNVFIMLMPFLYDKVEYTKPEWL